jgi:hypothetical protein
VGKFQTHLRQTRLFSTLCDNFCLWNREMLTEKDFYDYFAEETISIGFVSTHKPEEPIIFIGNGWTKRIPIATKPVSLIIICNIVGSSRPCVISLNYIRAIDLCVLCVFVVRFTRSPAGLYLRIHFTHQTQESLSSGKNTRSDLFFLPLLLIIFKPFL